MTDTSRNPATMTNEELHAHFSELLVSRAEDMDTRLGEFDTKLTNVMDKIDGLEKSFNAKLDVRFKELLNRCPHPHRHPHMAHGAFRSRVGLLVRLPPHPRRLLLRLTHLRLPPLLLRHWGQTTGTTTTPTTTICLTRRLNSLHTYLLAVPDITIATLDHRYMMMIMLQSLN